MTTKGYLAWSQFHAWKQLTVGRIFVGWPVALKDKLAETVVVHDLFSYGEKDVKFCAGPSQCLSADDHYAFFPELDASKPLIAKRFVGTVLHGNGSVTRDANGFTMSAWSDAPQRLLDASLFARRWLEVANAVTALSDAAARIPLHLYGTEGT